MTLAFGNMNLGPLIPGTDLDLCISATAPNLPMETTLANNSSCEAIEIIVDTQEPITPTGALHVYPNPVNELLNVDLPEEARDLHIFDALGSVLLHQQLAPNTHTTTVDLKNLAAGVYTLQVETAQGLVSSTFVRQ